MTEHTPPPLAPSAPQPPAAAPTDRVPPQLLLGTWAGRIRGQTILWEFTHPEVLGGAVLVTVELASIDGTDAGLPCTYVARGIVPLAPEPFPAETGEVAQVLALVMLAEALSSALVCAVASVPDDALPDAPSDAELEADDDVGRAPLVRVEADVVTALGGATLAGWHSSADAFRALGEPPDTKFSAEFLPALLERGHRVLLVPTYREVDLVAYSSTIPVLVMEVAK